MEARVVRMAADASSGRAAETSRLARSLARIAVVLLTIILYNAIAIWGSFALGATPDASLWDVFSAPFWMPVLYSFASPWYPAPLVLFAVLYVAVTSIWAEVLVRRSRHVLVASAAALLSMSISAGFAALTQDETYAWTHGFPVLAIARFTSGAALAALIVSSLFPSKRSVSNER